MKYYIEDLHLGHENIIRLSKRPFKTVQEMDDVIIDNINSLGFMPKTAKQIVA